MSAAEELKARLSREKQDEAANLAQRMAKAAGKVNPVVMVAACAMLVECSWMARDPSGYVEFKIGQDSGSKT